MLSANSSRGVVCEAGLVGKFLQVFFGWVQFRTGLKYGDSIFYIIAPLVSTVIYQRSMLTLLPVQVDLAFKEKRYKLFRVYVLLEAQLPIKHADKQ